MILVPHEPTLPTLERLELSLNYTMRVIRFSDLNDYSNENVILVDSIGILMSLYQYADVAYVGGASARAFTTSSNRRSTAYPCCTARSTRILRKLWSWRNGAGLSS